MLGSLASASDACGGGAQVALDAGQFVGDGGESAVGVADVCCPAVGAKFCVHGVVELGARPLGALVRGVGVALGLADLVRVGVGVGDLMRATKA